MTEKRVILFFVLLLAISGMVAWGFNFAWLINLTPKPPESVESARWIYGGSTLMTAAMIYSFARGAGF